MTTDPKEEAPIIFFDGVCNLCNSLVDLLLRLDKRQAFRFASLQGETAARLLGPLAENPHTWSVVYVDEQGVHNQSDAALAICRRLGGVWVVLAWFRMVPRVLRDPVYRLIARYRYHLFGRRETCRIPTVAERTRFLP